MRVLPEVGDVTFEERTFILADPFERINRLEMDHEAPLPLGYANAVRRGLQLRSAAPHLSYPAIGYIMAEYHGIRRSPAWWSRELKTAGAEARPRGVPLNGATAA
jgi:hypothetical protein